LIRHAAKTGWNTSVIAVSATRVLKTRGAAWPASIPDTTRVHRIDPRRLPDDASWMPRTAQWFTMALEMFRRGRLHLRKHPPTVIVATGPGFHTFIAGHFLSRHFGAPLVLDYRDEWTLRPPFPWVDVRPDDRRWEARCLARADRVLFVTGPLMNLYLRRFPGLERGRCRVVRNGWEPGDFGLANAGFPPPANSPSATTIGYFGFMAEHQRPRPFLQSVEKLLESRALDRRTLRILIAGLVDGSALDELAGFKYPAVLRPLRWVSRRRAARLMQRCTALLIVNDPLLSRALPTKLFEYLASGRPILVYGNGESEMKSLVARLGAGLAVPENDDRALRDALRRFRDSPASRWQTAARLRFLRQHTRELMAGRMLDEARAAIRAQAAAAGAVHRKR
jgi:glycosyltransferase involved in cell wall biosynthesis